MPMLWNVPDTITMPVHSSGLDNRSEAPSYPIIADRCRYSEVTPRLFTILHSVRRKYSSPKEPIPNFTSSVLYVL
jgi:hypothetical protein